ncbi:MAG: C4-dicarboxylate ABC transporter [Proteobacteria bacterium]|nr:MAG: C4-dicarboxylate ABC transporter [Pseudomonadota bacterium]
MKKFIKVLCAVALLASTGLLAKADYTIKFSHVVSPDSPKGKAADFFAKRVGELTNGKVKVEVFPNSQLYTDAAVMKALKIGNVHMAAPSFSKFTSLVPALQLFDLPFLFRDNDHLHNVMDGEVGQALKDMVTKKGFIALDFWDNGFKQFSSNKKAIVSPKDTVGQKVRIMSSKVLEAQMKALNANPQVLPFSEVYSALQQGVVDGGENPLSNFYTKKFYEVQTSLSMTNHGYLGYLVVMSKRFWKKFPSDLKPKIMQAMKEATAKERVYAAELDAFYLDKVKAYEKSSGKIKIYYPSKEQIGEFRKATEVIYPEFYKTIGKDLIEKAKATK